MSDKTVLDTVTPLDLETDYVDPKAIVVIPLSVPSTTVKVGQA